MHKAKFFSLKLIVDGVFHSFFPIIKMDILFLFSFRRVTYGRSFGCLLNLVKNSIASRMFSRDSDMY